jgi:FkbM family methyltransferase
MGAINTIYKKSLKKMTYYLSFEANEIKRIKKIPRYQKGNTKLFGFDFTFIDSASFVGQYLEIFNKKINNFKTNKEQPYIVDCGANIGVSVLFFKKIYPNANIIAFEPDKNIFSVLKKNIEKSNCKGIILINKGVWNKEGKIFFNNEGADGGSILEKNNVDPLNKKCVEIETTSLRDYLNKEVDFLKIDIEGAESTVLEDCDDLLKNVHRMFIEFHSGVDSEQHLDSILNILKKNGFRYYIQSETIFNDEPFIKRRSLNNYDNLVCIYSYRK